MPSHGLSTSVSQPNSGVGLQSPVVQPWEPHDSPTTYEGLTVPDVQVLSTPTPVPRPIHHGGSTHTRGGSKRIHDRATGPHPSLTRWSLIGPCEFILSRVAQPKCASTAELFGHLPGYLQHVHPRPQEEEDNNNRDDHDEGALTQDILSPLKKLQRKGIRERAGVKPKPPTKRTAGPSIPKPKPSLPPVGRVRCLWGGGCTVEMAFDYTPDTIKDWRNHIFSHLTKSNEPTEDPPGRCQKMVKCHWGGCGAKVERGYLFKHIVTHEVRFKLLCPRGCGVAFRDDNLERHLRSCRLSDQ